MSSKNMGTDNVNKMRADASMIAYVAPFLFLSVTITPYSFAFPHDAAVTITAQVAVYVTPPTTIVAVIVVPPAAK